MATISKDPQSGNYNVRFRFAERAYRRSLKTSSKKEALSALGRVEETMRLLARGSLVMPPDADPATFILTGGLLDRKPVASSLQTLGELFSLYEETLPDGAKEKSTLKTERIHMSHLGRVLKRQTPVRTLNSSAIQRYIRTRLSERNGASVKPVTVKKEVATLRYLWNWAVSQGHLQGASPTRGLQYPKSDEQLPFMTWAEIKAVVARGGLSEQEESQLWAALFLTTGETESILEHVKTQALHPQIYPMILFAAHTGARCSEILRSRIEDFDFQSRVIRIREKKRTQKKAVTFRHVPMTELMFEVFSEWFAEHPGGQYTIADEAAEPLTQEKARHHFNQTMLRSKWERVRGYHVFRHSFASNLAAAAVDQRIIDEWMGHQTDEMRKRYRHLFPEQQRKAIDRVFGRKSA